MGGKSANENDSDGPRDHLGCLLALATPDGEIVESYEYEPYGLPTIYDDEGEIVASRTSAVGNRFMFTGREWDELGEFYHYRHRTYSPHEKRFMQRDPIGLAGGWNVYAYCGGDPVNASDPMGLWPTETIGGQGGEIHQASIRRQLSGVLRRDYMNSLLLGVFEADGAEYQTVSMSYRHAMREPCEGTSAARTRTNQFIVNQVYLAREYWAIADRLEAELQWQERQSLHPPVPNSMERRALAEIRHAALYELGVGMHAAQDATSPVHCGFAEWNPPSNWFGKAGYMFSHGASENFDPGPGSALDAATARVWNLFIVPGPVPFGVVP